MIRCRAKMTTGGRYLVKGRAEERRGSTAGRGCFGSRREALGAGVAGLVAMGQRSLGALAAESPADQIAKDYDGYSRNYDNLEVGELAKAFELDALRTIAVTKAAGRTLEIGIGTGLNLELYDFDKVTHLTGFDISTGMLDKSRERVVAKGLEGKVDLVQGDAAKLPFEDNSFDSVVVSYSLCVVPDARSSLGEIARVLRPSGSGFVVEHISSDIKPLALYQKFLAPFVRKYGKGCDPSKDIPSLAQESGLAVYDLDRRVLGTVAYMRVKANES
ncbi:S-adenosyl-L-methionine-dependent methyltransferase [Chloropicon primus]|uniref:S-adenosyl-L-methionine-dependent methyltransferase n=1 Tax=Chloropicon primus TaxID=1764295 RepID=A0A5B8MNE0_9CHLO|nr:S-adenosyl-L-methionine-dependent methyltransferase [Chloropicon primus]|eukprot:QDZ21917.1 S-adenosyl-L-methionine-dependent methyltransferase [Chloropicon primus]